MTFTYILIAFIFGITIGKYTFGHWTSKLTKLGKPSEALNILRQRAHQTVKIRKNKRKAKILALAQKQGKITNDDVEDMFCISDDTARRYLNELESENKLKQIGTAGRGVHYTKESKR